MNLLTRAHMHESKSLSTLMTSNQPKLSVIADALPDPTLYRSIVSGLQYLNFTRPDILFSVTYTCLFMQTPTKEHFQLVKSILKYLQCTKDLNFRIMSHTTLDLYAFSDPD